MLQFIVMRCRPVRRMQYEKFIPEIGTLLRAVLGDAALGKTHWVKSKETSTSFGLSLCPGTLPGTEG
jgi:hypothetical protein